jgi:predicted amidohydrolase YtcJ
LQEGAAYDVLRGLIPAPDAAEWMECLRVAQRHLLAYGITGWQDAWVERDLLRACRALDDDGELTVRVVTSLWWDRHRGLEQIDDLLEMREWGAGGNVDTGTVKIMLDGCPENGTGAMLAPYEEPFDHDHGSGIQFVDAETLNEAVAELDALGFQGHQHALGDRGIRSALDALQAARTANGMNDLRHHVAHLQFPDPADVPRLRSLGVVANCQPYWAQPDPAIEELVKPRVGERVERLYPIGDLKRSGAVLAFGSDWPVSTPDPFRQIEVAVTRRSPDDDDGPALHEEQRIELPDAIAAFTRGSAYVNRDDDAGSIEEGKRADLIVLDRNLFDRSAGSIHHTQVVTTIAAGRVVHERRG